MSEGRPPPPPPPPLDSDPNWGRPVLVRSLQELHDPGDVSRDPFFGSKTMVLVCIAIGTIVGLILLGVVVKIVFDIDVFEMIAAGIAGITGNTGAGTYRNVRVDGSTRYAAASSAPPYSPPPYP